MVQNIFISKPELVLDIGVKGMINVLEACKKNNIKELILASSSEVYQIPKKIPTNENVIMKIPDVFNPRYSYAAGKIISEVLAINNLKFLKNLSFLDHIMFMDLIWGLNM